MSACDCPSPFEICIEEGGSFEYSGKLVDQAGDPVALAALTDLTVTLIDRRGEIINSRNRQSVKNTNGGTYHATSGEFTVQFLAADNPMVNGQSREERHIATFQASYGSGRTKNWEVHITVKNLASV